jgi:hypothetical protein
MILADPNAARFYKRSGAVRIGEPPSDAVLGRLLPPYEIRPDPTACRHRIRCQLIPLLIIELGIRLSALLK